MEDNKDNIYARWAAGELSIEEVDQLRRSGELTELEAIISATDELTLPPYDQAKAYKDIVAKRAAPEAVPRMSSFTKVALVISILGGIIAGYVLVTYLIGSQDKPVMHYAELSDTTTVDLQDQSRVVINDGSTISYDEASYLGERAIRLTGEAYFDVVPGSKFSVTTDAGTITVVGTAFNVRSWDGALQVECYEGSVEVSAGTSSVLLSPQDAATLQDDGELVVSKVTYTQPQWQIGISRFDSTPIRQVWSEMERQYDIKIEYKGGDKIFQGAFSHGNLATALQEVCRPMDLTYEVSADKKTVVVE